MNTKKILKTLTKLMIMVFLSFMVIVLVGNWNPHIDEVAKNPTSDISSQVDLHSTASDCWLIVKGKIYNVTPLFGLHPGGDRALERYCGKDATAAFETRDKNPPQSHSSADEALLQEYLVK